MRKLVTEGLNNLPKSDNWKVVKPGYKLGARAWCSAFSEARSWGSYVCGLCAECVPRSGWWCWCWWCIILDERRAWKCEITWVLCGWRSWLEKIRNETMKLDRYRSWGPHLSRKGVWGLYNGTTYTFHQVTLRTLAANCLWMKQCRHLAGGWECTLIFCRWPSCHWLAAIRAYCSMAPTLSTDSRLRSPVDSAWIERSTGNMPWLPLSLTSLHVCIFWGHILCASGSGLNT